MGFQSINQSINQSVYKTKFLDVTVSSALEDFGTAARRRVREIVFVGGTFSKGYEGPTTAGTYELRQAKIVHGVLPRYY